MTPSNFQLPITYTQLLPQSHNTSHTTLTYLVRLPCTKMIYPFTKTAFMHPQDHKKCPIHIPNTAVPLEQDTLPPVPTVCLKQHLYNHCPNNPCSAVHLRETVVHIVEQRVIEAAQRRNLLYSITRTQPALRTDYLFEVTHGAVAGSTGSLQKVCSKAYLRCEKGRSCEKFHCVSTVFKQAIIDIQCHLHHFLQTTEEAFEEAQKQRIPLTYLYERYVQPFISLLSTQYDAAYDPVTDIFFLVRARSSNKTFSLTALCKLLAYRCQNSHSFNAHWLEFYIRYLLVTSNQQYALCTKTRCNTNTCSDLHLEAKDVCQKRSQVPPTLLTISPQQKDLLERKRSKKLPSNQIELTLGLYYHLIAKEPRSFFCRAFEKAQQCPKGVACTKLHMVKPKH